VSLLIVAVQNLLLLLVPIFLLHHDQALTVNLERYFVYRLQIELFVDLVGDTVILVSRFFDVGVSVW